MRRRARPKPQCGKSTSWPSAVPLRSGFALNDETHVPRSMRYMVVNDSFGCVPPCCAVRE
ncbi:hypothetical protein HMPREF3231_01809 [Bifidobacterium longum]|nr:hypothetical protein HMPREF3231_01809 [Bifidobacterium longum]